jgi:hypothetical protein
VKQVEDTKQRNRRVLEQQIDEKAKKLEAELTFKPKINEASAIIANRSASR